MLKDKKEFILPGATLVYQPNRVTNGRYNGFSGIQLKILSTIIKELQPPIKHNIFGDGKPEQLELFKPGADGLVVMNLKLSDFATPNNYKKVLAAIDEMAMLKVELDPADMDIPKQKKKEYRFYAPIFSKIGEPKKLNGKSVISVYFIKDVAKHLISIDKGNDGRAIQYTGYLWEVAMNAKNKYTSRFYWLICSWKKREGFRMSVDELRHLLSLGEKYKNYNDLKKNVILPAQQELKEIGDYWFNAAADDFEEAESKTGKVLYLNFKIIKRKDRANDQPQFDNIRQLLRVHAGFSDEQLLELQPVFNSHAEATDIVTKTVEIIQYVKDPVNKVGNKQAYILKSLLNAF